MKRDANYLRSWFFLILLVVSVFLGGLTGYLIGDATRYLKPLGDIFLNLLFTAIVPLIFFAVATAIAATGSYRTLGRLLLSMLVVFFAMGSLAALYALLVVKCFPPALGVSLPMPVLDKLPEVNLSNQLVSLFTVPEFTKLLSHQHLLALIVFSMLVGLAAGQNTETVKPFTAFLKAGEVVFMRLFSFIMLLAPIGFFAYFAVMVHQLGPQLMSAYWRVAMIYYGSAVIYFFLVYSGLVYLAAKSSGVKLFWKQSVIPAVTALATCSSAASIPANLAATKAMGIPANISETVIPLGTILHKEGSIIGGVVKIAFLFGVFNMSFSSLPVLVTVFFVALLVGTVMGAIPSGGMLGELFILSV